MNAVLWVLLWAALVVGAHSIAAVYSFLPGEYWSGAICLILFGLLGWYSVRKRSLWFSVRLLRATGRLLPDSLQKRIVIADRLESWRAVHITLGVATLLPLWWHVSAGLMSTAEAILAIAVALLLGSGLFGVAIQEYLPPAIQAAAEREVRLEDVASRIDAVYVEAEEAVLGHQEALVQAYVSELKPVLEADRSVGKWRLLMATLSGASAAGEICEPLRAKADRFGADAATWNSLVDLAARKINLEHNAFNLRLSTSWLNFHIALAIFTFALLLFHVGSVLYFQGL